MISDESRFTLDFLDMHGHIRRHHANINLKQHNKLGGRSIIIRGGITMSARTPLHTVVLDSTTETTYQRQRLCQRQNISTMKRPAIDPDPPSIEHVVDMIMIWLRVLDFKGHCYFSQNWV